MKMPMLILTVQVDSNFRFLMLELILAEQLAEPLPPVVASSGQD